MVNVQIVLLGISLLAPLGGSELEARTPLRREYAHVVIRGGRVVEDSGACRGASQDHPLLDAYRQSVEVVDASTACRCGRSAAAADGW